METSGEAQRKIKENGIKAAHRQEAQQEQAVPLRELKGCPCIRDVNIRPNLSRGARGSLGNLEVPSTPESPIPLN
ncbi:hypothetical protein AK812_SmicGene44462 [Symbiodinium microadriaticum]|uniref:Uncharacterized protein n=1 Tax=Symbiodinium microadriaticum TaxID=2951 RepID=A0A1Q9BYP0_SYMMI|nr:hypothetical protein AK812_SmicGene44462 [Symbiodinium microadriaticum]